MIQNLLINFIQIFIGFAGGIAVGAGFVAFLTVLGIIPRLIQLSKTEKLLKAYGVCVIFGLLLGTFLSFTNVTWNQHAIILVFWGILHGIFNGMLAAALTEILNVFPILYKRIGVEKYMLWMLMAILFGKVAGSLFQWVFFVK